jgi:hypothetical protein
MANTRISDLSAGGAIISTDIFPSVETAGVGPVTKTGAQLAEYARDVIAAFAVAGSNIGIVHDDVNDTLTFSYTGVIYTDADAVGAMSDEVGANGIVVRSAADTFIPRSIAAGTGIEVSNGDGVSGNPTVSAATPVSFFAETSSDQAGLTDNTFTHVDFDTEIWDEGSYFNTSTGAWTPPAGRYLLNVQVSMIPSVPGTIQNGQIRVMLNGTTTLINGPYVVSGVTTLIRTVLTHIFETDGTDAITIEGRINTSDGSTFSIGGDNCFFQGFAI